ncbi:DUF3108 domain-containing protein [Alteromonas pelagimontana]|uniref:DUF3108 domain-containing protein n=1 Tax=Alteromonas pelagimontana TaxID=1858656 RepID=A0A6M4M894_9ALTE|nr:DUF3108 domain-containing protein [Alteromonas pelagimontana]QJR79383.1 DUF3108 domain-containing protein [Alteromonas pelagimontana]
MQTIRSRFAGACIALAISSMSAHADEKADRLPLVPFHATYTAYKWQDDVGKAELKLEKLAKAQYSLTYSSDVSKFFLSDERFEHSIFNVIDGELIPDQYYYSRTGTGSDKHLQIDFQPAPSPKIVIDKQKKLPWHAETDNQLYRIDLPRQLAAGEENVEYHFINYRGQLKTYGIEILGRETLSLPYGELKTIKVKLIRQSQSRVTFAWFAPSLDYNLVRLQQFKDGDEQGEIRLQSYRHL